MLGCYRKDDRGILAALRLVDGYGISRNNLIEIRIVVRDKSSVKVNGDFAVLGINPGDPSDVSVEDFPVVIVDSLHDLVTESECLAANGEASLAGVQSLL